MSLRSERETERERKLGTERLCQLATVHTPKRVFVRFHFTPNYPTHVERAIFNRAPTPPARGGRGRAKWTGAALRRRRSAFALFFCPFFVSANEVKIHKIMCARGEPRRVEKILARAMVFKAAIYSFRKLIFGACYFGDDVSHALSLFIFCLALFYIRFP